MNCPTSQPVRQPSTPPQIPTRDLFVRGVPEEVWDLVHHNALQSRLRLKPYLIELMRQSRPFPRPTAHVPALLSPGEPVNPHPPQ